MMNGWIQEKWYKQFKFIDKKRGVDFFQCLFFLFLDFYLLFKMMKIVQISLVLLLFFQLGCNKNEVKHQQWAHKVDDTLTAKAKQHLFKGFEVDLIYSSFQDKLFVCHDIEDTILNLTFRDWLQSIDEPHRLNYWLDMKYLDNENVKETASLLKKITKEFSIEKNIIVESYNDFPLKILKENDIPVLFWVDDMQYWEDKDTAKWIKKVTDKLEQLKPNGISGSVHSFPLLSNTFPDYDVYYWNTPISDTLLNKKLTKELAEAPNVKVILVDYEQPMKLE